MAYFVFIKDSDNLYGTFSRIIENDSELLGLGIGLDIYKSIVVSDADFKSVRNNEKIAIKYDGDNITYSNTPYVFKNKEKLLEYVNPIINKIKEFLDNNPLHPLKNKWQNYYNTLNNFNYDSINYPLNGSFETYLDNLNNPVLNTLQLP
jgi:hypothetical protein